MAQTISTGTFTAATWIVNSDASKGTHTTLAGALTTSTSGDTILLQTSVTENITLKAGVNIVAWIGSEQTPNISITGKLSFSSAGTVSISGIRLTTNSDNFLAVTGSAASRVILENCYLNASNNTGISFTAANTSAFIQCYTCDGDIGTTGVAFFSNSSTGTLNILYSKISNTGSSTTASTSSAGATNINNSALSFNITSTVTGVVNFFESVCAPSGNTTAFICGTTSTAYYTRFLSGSATTITITGTLSAIGCIISSTNTAAISGAGTILYSDLSFEGSSSNITVTTQTILQQGPNTTIGSSNSGATNTLLLTNSSNTVSSNALLNISVGGTSSNDPFQTFTIAGTTNWSQGPDNSVTGDPFTLSASTALGTTNVMTATTAGQINQPLQSSFFAYLPSSDLNKTGNGATFTIGSATALTEKYDQNNDFVNTTGVFTAPVTGRYYFSGSVYAQGCTVATLSLLSIVSTGQTISSQMQRTASANDFGNTVNAIITMTAGDTASLQVLMSGEAGNTDDIFGNAAAFTYFCGSLIN